MVSTKKTVTPKQSLLRKLNSRSFKQKYTDFNTVGQNSYKKTTKSESSNCSGPKIPETYFPDNCPNCMDKSCPGISSCI